ncbi:MAG TPA: tRNA (adenosine(37)-N6)-threonylcarbamoyltransferase complex dimerization subunit type 1 TsaB [Chitinophagaceae bacterium]|nr:tRNA (adenosine(37)-N6)-threonylcarbamoyltransferase complex dimerization subunit type 1 TsaB [Chitinophagaceae bacterium]
MSWILNIDTAVQKASICLANDNVVVAFAENDSQKDHASWLHLAILHLVKQQGLSVKNIDAIAISAGPGSYTGLRVGMATAKGLCYTMDKPLIFISTLQMMASAAINEDVDLLCPMIDARRMEVFTAVYDKALNEHIAPHNCILSDNCFDDLLNQRIAFLGNGSVKFKSLVSNPNAVFTDIEASAKEMTLLSYKKFTGKAFEDVAYSEPFYGKEFYSTAHLTN